LPAARHFVPAGSSAFHRAKGQCRCRRKADESPLFGFLSLQRIPTEPAIFLKAASLQIIPLQRFFAHAVLGATPLRRRLTSFASTTVDRGIDHASPASFSVAFRYRSRLASAWPIILALL